MRITNHIRSKIEEALINHAFAERRKAMSKRENDLALKLYRTRVPEALERASDKLNEQAAEVGIKGAFVATCGVVEVDRPGFGHQQLTLSHRRPWSNQYNGPKVELKDDSDLASEFEAFVADNKKLIEEVHRTGKEIRATLAPIHTEKALRAAWPEVMSIAEPILVENGVLPKEKPLVVATENLNAVLGLPVDAEAEKEAA